MKVGVVVGTFDMFHVGHLNLFINAKKNCDYLIIGVNADNVVIRDKHIIPTISEEDRLKIVSNTKQCDEAYLVYDNAYLFIKSLINSGKQVDFYFRGDEKSDNIMKENGNISALGVSVVLFPYYQKISSTKIRQTLKKG